MDEWMDRKKMEEKKGGRKLIFLQKYKGIVPLLF